MPGLLRGVARTAVIAGTATAVSNRVSRRQAGRWADQDATAGNQQHAEPPRRRRPRRAAAVDGRQARPAQAARRAEDLRRAHRRRVRSPEGEDPGRLTATHEDGRASSVGCPAFAWSAATSGSGCDRIWSPVSCSPRSSCPRAWPTPSWPACPPVTGLVHDDRVPDRLRAVRSVTGARARTRLVDLAADLRGDRAARRRSTTRRRRSHSPGCWRCSSGSSRSVSAWASSASSPTCSRARCRSGT